VRVAIVGNSGSGKSTLAKRLAEEHGVDALDLDTVAWEPGKIAVPRDPKAALADVESFCSSRPAWVVEGCYADLVAAALKHGPELVFADPGEEECLRRCRARPWEPHKYPSKAEQDAKLEFLLSWVSDYYRREGPLSYAAHRALYDAYAGPKRVAR
jgi:adenylate kinase family enzyme